MLTLQIGLHVVSVVGARRLFSVFVTAMMAGARTALQLSPRINIEKCCQFQQKNAAASKGLSCQERRLKFLASPESYAGCCQSNRRGCVSVLVDITDYSRRTQMSRRFQTVVSFCRLAACKPTTHKIRFYSHDYYYYYRLLLLLTRHMSVENESQARKTVKYTR